VCCLAHVTGVHVTWSRRLSRADRASSAASSRDSVSWDCCCSSDLIDACLEESGQEGYEGLYFRTAILLIYGVAYCAPGAGLCHGLAAFAFIRPPRSLTKCQVALRGCVAVTAKNRFEQGLTWVRRLSPAVYLVRMESEKEANGRIASQRLGLYSSCRKPADKNA